MNSSSKPASPNSGNLASASGYEKIGNALGGWGGGSTTQNNTPGLSGYGQPYGQFPSMGKQPVPQYQDWTDTRPPGERSPIQNTPINDWTDTRPPSERGMPGNPSPGGAPGPMPEQPVGDWGPGGSIAPQPQGVVQNPQAPQEPMLAYPPAPQVMPQPIAGPMLNPGYKPYEEPMPVQRKFPGFNGMMT